MSLAERHRRFTVDEYYRMAEVGILRRGDRVELLEGEILEMSPIGSRHAACVDRLNRMFVRAGGERVIVRVQNPVRLSRYSEPEPDLSLLRPRKDFYAERHPAPGDVLLIVEVADTPLEYDRGRKTKAYARARIPELWIVDLEAGVVLVRRDPSGWSYRTEEQRRRGEQLDVRALEGVVLPVDEILC